MAGVFQQIFFGNEHVAKYKGLKTAQKNKILLKVRSTGGVEYFAGALLNRCEK